MNYSAISTLFYILGFALVAACVWLAVSWANTPDVIYSWSTKECKAVQYMDGRRTDCTHLPKHYNFVWGE